MLDLTEFLAVVAEKLSDADTKDHVRSTFKYFKGSSGQVSVEDLERVADEVGERWSQEELREMISVLDRNGDGLVTEDEFVAGVLK